MRDAHFPIEKIINQYLNDIAHTRRLLDAGQQQQVLRKLAVIESSLQTTLAMQQMQLQECTEHIQCSDYTLPAAN